MPPNQQDEADINKLAEAFIANPEAFILYRGENMRNRGGLHFTTDKKWSRNFGEILLCGNLPAGAKIKLITHEDFEMAFRKGITSDHAFYESVFIDGYDAVVGHDTRNSDILDIIVSPKLINRFTQELGN